MAWGALWRSVPPWAQGWPGFNGIFSWRPGAEWEGPLGGSPHLAVAGARGDTVRALETLSGPGPRPGKRERGCAESGDHGPRRASPGAPSVLGSGPLFWRTEKDVRATGFATKPQEGPQVNRGSVASSWPGGGGLAAAGRPGPGGAPQSLRGPGWGPGSGPALLASRICPRAHIRPPSSVIPWTVPSLHSGPWGSGV